MACTFRVAVPTAKLGLPEIKLGLIPVYGGTQLLPRLIGQSRALQMMLTGDSVTADHGERIGLVDRLVAEGGDVLQEACAMALAHGQYSLPAQQAIRRAVREGADLLLGDGLRLELELGRVVSASEDAREGIQAFVEKRKAVFKDR
jgi:enoyl-CoA hydratase